MNEPTTQAQDHDRRIGRLEEIDEQLDRRLDSIAKRLDSIERAIGELRQDIAALNRRLDTLTRWMVGMQIATLLILGTLILSRSSG